MLARLFLLLILFSTLTAFFWEDEEKQLRQLQHNGETALQKGEFESAKEAYQELWSRITVALPQRQQTQKYKVDWTTYIDIAIRLATCYEELKESTEAEKILTLVLGKRPPEEFLPKLQLMKARIVAKQQAPEDAYIAMNAIISRFTENHWSSKELSFFHILERSLNEHYDTLIAKAKRYLLTGFYPQAISLYEEALAAIEKGCYPKAKKVDSLIIKTIRYRLAECYFLAANYEKSLLFCGDQKEDDKLDREMLYLSALCYREKKEFEKALDLFQIYAHQGEIDDLEHYDQALFEIGSYYYQHAQKVKARRYFERLLQLHQFNKKSSHLAAIYLARIYLDEKIPKEAERLLSQMMVELNAKDPLRYEYFYLRGLATYALGDYAMAKDLFERSLPENNSGWILNSLYHLGWCYLRLGDDPLKATSVRLEFFNQARHYFEKCLKISNQEAAVLSLAQLYLLRFRHLGESLDQLSALLQNKEHFSLNGQVEAFMLLAEAQSSYEEKEILYALATDEKYKQAPQYPQAWYQRGLNYFQEGLRNPQHGDHLFELATASFEKAFRWIHQEDKQKAASILKLNAKANLCRNSAITSLALLEKLLMQYEENVEEREETLYLRGLLASRFIDLSYFPVAEESLLQVVNNYPNGKYCQDALFALATLYYAYENFEASKNIFIKLAENYPKSAYAPQAWFWAAEAVAQLGENPTPYRYQVYQNYPESELGAEAYFRQFTYAHYVEGNTEALSHLREFNTLFPHAPLACIVNYLIGIHEKDFEKAKIAFKNALSAFCDHRLQCTESGVDTAYIHCYYKTILELAALYLSSGFELTECEQLLTDLVSDFSEHTHPLTSILKQQISYPPLFEEGEFKLVQCYLQQGKNHCAQKMLVQMLNHYTEAGIQEGYYLSLVWQEQGKLAMCCQDYDTALKCFEIADECSGKHVPDDHKLGLWLLESDAFRGKKEYDTAMRLLSRVINAETASPLRLKAMYLRAEIYELEGRPELAVRQLEATAKKGGEWAHLAKEKLRSDYGLE